jgi:phosphopentomutase
VCKSASATKKRFSAEYPFSFSISVAILKHTKAIVVVLDGVGVGELPDANEYGDIGTNTLGNIARAVGKLSLPNLERLGLGNIAPVQGVVRVAIAEGCYGKMAEQSKGKDSTTGHWEIAGIVTNRPFPVYPNGFPAHLLEAFRSVTGVQGVLGNKAASGTEIIKELGDEHVRTGFPIVYTSADSVFQIAAHEEVVPLTELYEICRLARDKVLVGEHAVGRVIARPFVGKTGTYSRTTNRRDFSIKPPRKTLLDILAESGIETVGVGKIDDLFAGRGLKEKLHTKSNGQGIEEIVRSVRKLKTGFVMANLVDFDVQYGHRQDAAGFARELEAFDRELPRIQESMEDEDLLILTADHGNDPTDKSTDHSREYVPLLCWRRSGKKNIDLGVRKTFADLGRTVAEFFGISSQNELAGVSFLKHIV